MAKKKMKLVDSAGTVYTTGQRRRRNVFCRYCGCQKRTDDLERHCLRVHQRPKAALRLNEIPMEQAKMGSQTTAPSAFMEQARTKMEQTKAGSEEKTPPSSEEPKTKLEAAEPCDVLVGSEASTPGSMANAESLNQVEPCAPNGVPDEVMTPAQERASMIERLRGVKMEMRELWQRIGKLEKELAAEQDEDVPLVHADTAAHRSRDQVLQVSSKSMEHCVTGIKAARVMLDDGWKGMQARQKRYEALE